MKLENFPNSILVFSKFKSLYYYEYAILFETNLDNLLMAEPSLIKICWYSTVHAFSTKFTYPKRNH